MLGTVVPNEIGELATAFDIADASGLHHALLQAYFMYGSDDCWRHSHVEAARFADRLDEALDVLGHHGDWIEAALASQECDASDVDAETAVERVEQRVRDLEYLRDLARAASAGEQAARRGRPQKNKDLTAFVAQLAKYWREDLGRPFTADFHDGDPITKAAQFVVAAARHWDLPVTAAQVRSAMVGLITTYNKSGDLS